jgi:hypothetical protein
MREIKMPKDGWKWGKTLTYSTGTAEALGGGRGRQEG